ncbi:putative trafficking protein particle complex subunit TRS31 [Nosema granulosis]|uniref:Trafficking protein particle complex subunit TRS31 n=1 Tax=Nosema granulosis TaxID=83296 RepID=A0A9P6KZU1_9MICR|nr:putative trafficking protein particle complex subunit TRS31 [Nosema granulosis]
MKEIDSTFSCYLLCGLVETLKDKDSEEELKKVGYLLGRSLVEIVDFKRETDLGTLLYKITYTLLEKYYPSPRKLEISKEHQDVYYIVEYSPLYSRFISNKNNFCGDSVTCGIIMYGIRASGYECEVNGYVNPCERYPNRVIYEITVKPRRIFT